MNHSFRKKLILLSLLLAAVLYGFAGSGQDSVRVHNMIRKGRVLDDSDGAAAQSFYNRAVRLADSLNLQDEMIAYTLVAMADYDTYRGKLDSAMHLSLKALKFYEDNGKTKESIRSLSRIGDILRANGMYDKSYDYFRKALRILREVNDSTLLASVYNRLSASYYEDLKVSLDSSSKYALLSLSIARKLNLRGRISNNLNILGSIESKKGNYLKAIDYYNQALPILSEVAPVDMALTLANMGSNYEKIKNYGKAEEANLKALELARKAGIPQYIWMACKNLSSTYQVTGRYKEACKYLELYSQIESELLSQRVLVQVQDFDNRIEIEKRNDENKRLEYEQQITKGQFKFTLILSIFLFFILISAAVFLVFQQKQRRKINQVVAKLDQSNVVLRRFISILAHDLRSPFNSILGFSDILKNEPDLSEREREMAVNSLSQTSHLTYHLLERLLEWSQLESGSIHPKKKLFILNEHIVETISLLNHAAQLKNIVLEFKAIAEVKIFADPNMIQTAVRNVISNAIKFTRPGGWVSVSLETSEDIVHVVIQDNGIGMTADVLNKVFRIEENYKSKGTSGESGTGLGLILCKEYIEMNGGNIKIISDPEKGSTFTLELPLGMDQLTNKKAGIN